MLPAPNIFTLILMTGVFVNGSEKRLNLCAEVSRFFPNLCDYQTTHNYCSHLCNGSKLELQCGEKTKKDTNNRMRRIVGGKLSSINEWRWHASLRLRGNHECAATILSEHFLITAAHCVDPNYTSDNPKLFTAVVGTDFRTKHTIGEQSIRFKRIMKRSDYHVQFYPRDELFFVVAENDIALIELENEIDFTQLKVASICLPDDENQIPDDYLCYIVGWGKTKFEGQFSEQLNYAEIRTVANNICNAEISFNRTINKNITICAGDSNATTSPCNNDSGGGMTCQKNGTWYINGIISSGYKCGGPNAYSLYTNVGKFKDWIIETIFNQTLNETKKLNQANSAPVIFNSHVFRGYILLVQLVLFIVIVYYS